jgi:hypothetical protein
MCGIPPWQARTIAIIFYQHNNSVGTSNWALLILDKLCRLHRILPWHSSPCRRPLRPQPPLHSIFWVRTARLVNYPASFEGLVLIEVCGMDIHIPPPLGFFALWLLHKGVQANRSITTT